MISHEEGLEKKLIFVSTLGKQKDFNQHKKYLESHTYYRAANYTVHHFHLNASLNNLKY